MRSVAWLLCISMLIVPGSLRADDRAAVLKAGDAMPDFTLKHGLSGQDVTFSGDIRGQSEVIGISFFNTGCSACMAEMEEMSTAAKALGEQKLRVYGIAVDKRGAQAVKAYNEIYNYKVTYLLDPNFTLPLKFGFSYTPACVLLNGEGTVMFVKGGYDPVRDSGLIVKEIKSILKME